MRDKLATVKKYINKNLPKGFIYLSSSPVASPVLLVKKLGEGL